MKVARVFHSNWACTSIRDLILEQKTDAREVADVLSSHPRFLATIQSVIDQLDDPGSDPNQTVGDPAEAVIAELSESLVAVD